MTLEHGFLVTLHLLCAAVFIGVVAFEVLIIEGIRPYLPGPTMSLVEEGIHVRGRKIMPYVIATLFATGIGLLVRVHFDAWWPPFTSTFSTLLTVKVVLATSVLVHFGVAMWKSVCATMTSRIFRITHISVFTHLVAIAVLAKAMFFLD